MKTLKLISLKAFFLLLSVGLFAQDYENYEDEEGYDFDKQVEVNPMMIPSSPAFSLLGVNPEMVMRPSDVKEFKVDWRIKNYKVAPDLALEAQPVWWLYYSKKSPKALSNINYFQRVLSTTTMSMATAKVDGTNHLAYALKFNLYKEYDPMLNADRIKAKEMEIREEVLPIDEDIANNLLKQNAATDLDSISYYERIVGDLRYERKLLKMRKMQEYVDESNELAKENWNMDMVDFAFGRVHKYNNSLLDSLKFEYAGYGMWLNGAKGIGKNGLLTGMLRLNRIGDNTDYMIGASYRVGSETFNFYSEILRSNKSNIIDNGFDDDEQFGEQYGEDLGIGWYKYAEGKESQVFWNMTFGGDFRLSRNILLNFSLRTEVTGELKFERFTPIANVVCLMK